MFFLLRSSALSRERIDGFFLGIFSVFALIFLVILGGTDSNTVLFSRLLVGFGLVCCYLSYVNLRVGEPAGKQRLITPNLLLISTFFIINVVVFLTFALLIEIRTFSGALMILMCLLSYSLFIDMLFLWRGGRL